MAINTFDTICMSNRRTIANAGILINFMVVYDSFQLKTRQDNLMSAPYPLRIEYKIDKPDSTYKYHLRRIKQQAVTANSLYTLTEIKGMSSNL